MRAFMLIVLRSLLMVGLSLPVISHADEQEAIKNYSPNTGRDYPTQVYFGDTHHHTANSGDPDLTTWWTDLGRRRSGIHLK